MLLYDAINNWMHGFDLFVFNTFRALRKRGFCDGWNETKSVISIFWEPVWLNVLDPSKSGSLSYDRKCASTLTPNREGHSRAVKTFACRCSRFAPLAKCFHPLNHSLFCFRWIIARNAPHRANNPILNGSDAKFRILPYVVEDTRLKALESQFSVIPIRLSSIFLDSSTSWLSAICYLSLLARRMLR
jgi:hypothetical protein